MLLMLNKLPGVRLAGENNHALHAIKTAIGDGVVSHVVKRGGTGLRIESPWGRYKIRPSDFACTVQDFFEFINPPDIRVQRVSSLLRRDRERTIVGFKTVRFDRNWTEKEAVQFVRDNFPCSRIVVNINSDTSHQAQSVQNTWAKKSDVSDLEQDLNHVNEKLVRVATLFDEQAFLMDTVVYSDNVTFALERINSLVERLGFRGCRFTKLVHSNKNHTYKVDMGARGMSLGRNCRYVGVWR
jgi:hypothetical protein